MGIADSAQVKLFVEELNISAFLNFQHILQECLNGPIKEQGTLVFDYLTKTRR